MCIWYWYFSVASTLGSQLYCLAVQRKSEREREESNPHFSPTSVSLYTVYMYTATLNTTLYIFYVRKEPVEEVKANLI